MDQARRQTEPDRQPDGADAVAVEDGDGRRLNAGTLFRFVQFEFPWALGPEDGRYLQREHVGSEAHHVIVLATAPGPVRPRRRRFGRSEDATHEPTETSVGTATVIDATAIGEAAAADWLARAPGDETAVDEALFSLNQVLRAQRAAAANPFVREVSDANALAVRTGYGTGSEVAEGEWTEAKVVPQRANRGLGGRVARRRAALRPQERLAAILAGRDPLLACEELTLRAREDLDAERPREAALQARIALAAAVAELAAFRDQADIGARIDELAGMRDSADAAASEALKGGLSPDTADATAHLVGRLEALLRARAANAVY